LGDASEAHRVLIEETWGAQPGWDEPLQTSSPAFPVDPAERGPRLAFYGKAYAFFAACEERAGAASVTRAVAALLAAPRPVASAEVRGALARAAPALEGASAGWVTTGDRELPPPKATRPGARPAM